MHIKIIALSGLVLITLNHINTINWDEFKENLENTAGLPEKTEAP
jgi:hypothetical protein